MANEEGTDVRFGRGLQALEPEPGAEAPVAEPPHARVLRLAVAAHRSDRHLPPLRRAAPRWVLRLTRTLSALCAPYHDYHKF